MKLIQQDFKVTSKLLFIITFIFSIGLLSSIFENNNDTIIRTLFNLIISIGGSILCAYCAYHFSFTYEFKQKGTIVKPLFGLLGKKKSYEFRYLKKIEYSSNPHGSIDCIILYFENREYKKQITISMWQVDLSKVRLFLYANVENFEELVEEKQRRF